MSLDLPPSVDKDLLGDMFHLMQEATPRDVNTLRKLKAHQLELLEVKITAVSASLGLSADELRLPPNTQVLALLRDEQALFTGF